MKPEDILAVYEASPQAAVKLLNNPMTTITELKRAAKDLGKSTQ